jgi:hypothetical protein
MRRSWTSSIVPDLAGPFVLADQTPLGWKRPFDNPIVLPDGRALVTLEDAGDYITMLPKADQQLDEWETAIECLMLVVKLGGPTMFARIGMLRALNRHVERVFDPSRKDKHWGRRQLARDR